MNMNIQKFTVTLLTTLAVSCSYPLFAQSVEAEHEAAQAAHEARRLATEALIEEAELKRQLAMEAAVEAEKAARKQEERARKEAVEGAEEQSRREEMRAREFELEARELAEMREELSRTHRELRETSRQVAQAHRELIRAEKPVHRIRHINLGDRAVIGLILGPQTEAGVEIIGVSPDGPAEQAGLLAGDVMVSIGGVDLAGEESGRSAIYRVMDEVSDGEELAVTVLRDQQTLDLMVTAERREPTAWQSLIRIPELTDGVDEPGTARVIVKTIELPEIDEEALQAEVAELQKKVESMEYSLINPEGFGHMMEGEWEFNFEGMSDFGLHAMEEAGLWFGLPQSQGLELATVNPDLGDYFETDRGVLVIRAKQDNAYQLRSGDVVLEIDAIEVDTPSDMMRAVRELDPGTTVDVLIKRERRDVTLKVVVPENRLTFRFHDHERD